MSWFSKEKTEETAIIRKVAESASVPPELQQEQNRATRGWVRKILEKFRGLTADDARRLKEAGVRMVEGKADKEINAARKLDAEAADKYADAEVKRQEAALKALEVQKKTFEQNPGKDELDIERIAAATERLADAISRIRQMGGDVQLTQLDALQGQIGSGEEKAKPSKVEGASAYLSRDEVTRMIKQKGYFDKVNNPEGQGIAHDYKLSADGKTVHDATTGLTWQQSGATDNMNYEAAGEYIKQINAEKYAGHPDWRLPTLEEVMSLMEPQKMEIGLFINPIFDKKQVWIWPADKNFASDVWVVDFSEGHCSNAFPIGINNLYVRAVR